MRAFFILFWMELKKLRQGWMMTLIMSSAFPLCLFFFTQMGLSGLTFYSLPGILVTSLVLNSTLTLGQELAQIKQGGALDYYATLPLSKASLFLAILARSFIFSLPSLVILLGVGAWESGLNPFGRLFLFLMVIILSALSLSGLGAWMGLALPSPRITNIATQAFYLFVVFCSPVMIPEDRFPEILALPASFLPTTYAASALRSLFTEGPLGFSFVKEVAVLAIFSFLSIAFSERKLSWRLRR